MSFSIHSANVSSSGPTFQSGVSRTTGGILELIPKHKVEMNEEKDNKNWNWAYAGVIGALIALIVFFYFFTQHFS